MFKNALRFATTFGVLLAGYAAYTQAFALMSEQLRRARDVPTASFATIESKGKRQAIGMAVRGFGPDHWTSEPDLQLRYYSIPRQFSMYAREYERSKDGKRLKFTPFAMVWLSRDGKALKTVTSDAAVIDLDQPLSLMAQPGGAGGSMRVVHARIEGDVRIRDDKGTPADLADDLRIRPGPYVEYDEAKLELTGDDNETVEIEDRDLRITGLGLLIKLRPKEEGNAHDGTSAPASSGFEGARTAILKKSVDITIGDVGPGGILPGNPQGPRKPGEKTPLHLRCDGLMQIDLPKPRLPVRVGPPSPPGLTFAQFFRNVEVIRGKAGGTPDSLTSDHLHLTLAPPEKDPAAEKAKAGPAAAAEAGASGPLNELTLRRARAIGHNVRITSAAQGVKARCNELIHEKHWPEAPDETYFRGDATTKLVVEKIDAASPGPNQAKAAPFTTLRAIDAKIFENGRGNDNATIVARGPGEMEWRPGLDQPVERTARWEDTLTLEADPVAAAAEAARLAKAGKGAAPRPVGKRVTLTGRPALTDVPSASALRAARTLVVWLKPKAAAPAQAQTAANPEGSVTAAGQSFEIEKLVALKDVHLTAPYKTLVARDRLDAEFHASAAPGKPAATTILAEATPPASDPNPFSVAKPSGTPDAKAGPDAKPKAPPRPVEPDARATANVVWASVLMRPDDGSGKPGASGAGTPSLFAGSPRAEVDKVYLRGGVTVHQNAAAGKTKGTDVTGEAVDLTAQGKGATRFVVFNHNPSAKPQALPKPDDKTPLAVIETEDMTIRGPVIGLDQSTDQAWVEGKGTLTQMTTRGLLSDKGLPDPPRAPALKPAIPLPIRKVPLTITWAKEMKFFGQSTDPQGRPTARAEFYQDVHAEMEDSLLACQDVMRAYFDRTMKLVRLADPSPKPVGETITDGDARVVAKKEPRPEIALIEMVKKVVVVNVKRDPVGGKDVVQKQKILGEYLIFEKATGKFRVPGAGEVFLYEVEGRNDGLAPKIGVNGAEARPGDPRVILTAADRDLNRAPPVVSRVPNPLDRAGGQLRARDQAKGKAKAKAQPRPKAKGKPLVLTQVKFSKDMLGRFGTGKDGDKVATRWADFFGNVEALRGPVPDADSVLDADKLGRDDQFITAKVLRVVSEPNLAAPDAPPRYLMRAWENAYAHTFDSVIQADTLTYDSEKSLFYAYGEEGRDVVIAQQGRIGQDASTVQGRAAKYNLKTGEAEVIEPKQMALVDLRTGSRPGIVQAPKTNVPIQKPKRTQLRNPRGNIDRKDFNGR